MEQYWYYVIALVLLIILFLIIKAFIKLIKPKFNYPYEKANLLTQNELNFYQTLRRIAPKYNLQVLAKVRLADIATIQTGISNKEYMVAFNKIRSKHVDFVLANPSNLEIKIAIELDDSSHDTADRQNRDDFVDKVYEKIGIPIIHTREAATLEKQIVSVLYSNSPEKVKSPAR